MELELGSQNVSFSKQMVLPSMVVPQKQVPPHCVCGAQATWPAGHVPRAKHPPWIAAVPFGQRHLPFLQRPVQHWRLRVHEPPGGLQAAVAPASVTPTRAKAAASPAPVSPLSIARRWLVVASDRAKVSNA
jgi:hypothetical protein